MMLLLQCPKCHHKMKYNSRGEYYGKTKKCVYCGKNFTIKEDRILELIKQ